MDEISGLISQYQRLSVSVTFGLYEAPIFWEIPLKLYGPYSTFPKYKPYVWFGRCLKSRLTKELSLKSTFSFVDHATDLASSLIEYGPICTLIYANNNDLKIGQLYYEAICFNGYENKENIDF